VVGGAGSARALRIRRGATAGRLRRTGLIGAPASGPGPSDRDGIAAVVRDEWSRVVATLVRDLGDLDLAEDCTQEAFHATDRVQIVRLYELLVRLDRLDEARLAFAAARERCTNEVERRHLDARLVALR
jgi:predicted RNA polymerase sigma factor